MIVIIVTTGCIFNLFTFFVYYTINFINSEMPYVIVFYYYYYYYFVVLVVRNYKCLMWLQFLFLYYQMNKVLFHVFD